MRLRTLVVSFCYVLISSLGLASGAPDIECRVVLTNEKLKIPNWQTKLSPLEEWPLEKILEFVSVNVAEYEAWVAAKHQKDPRSRLIPLVAIPGDPVTKQWSKIFIALYKKDPENWWQYFSEDLQELWKETGSVSSFHFRMQSFEGRLQIFSNWVRTFKDSDAYPQAMPLKDSIDTYDRMLFDFIKAVRDQNPDEWWRYFPEDVQAIWKSKGVFDRRRSRHRTEEERRQELVEFAREAVRENRPSFPKSTSTDENVKSMAEFIKSQKKKYGEDWYKQGFPEDVLKAWQIEGFLVRDLRVQRPVARQKKTGEINSLTGTEIGEAISEEKARAALSQKAEFENWVRTTNSGKSKAASLIPTEFAPPSRFIYEWAQVIRALSQARPEDWWKDFSPDIQEIWKSRNAIKAYEFRKFDIERKTQAVDQWVESVKNNPVYVFAMPSQTSSDLFESSIARFIIELKSEYPDSWWMKFSMKTQDIWTAKGVREREKLPSLKLSAAPKTRTSGRPQGPLDPGWKDYSLENAPKEKPTQVQKVLNSFDKRKANEE